MIIIKSNNIVDESNGANAAEKYNNENKND